MKALRNLLFVLILVSCNSTNQEEKSIKIFNDTFGKENTESLDEIVKVGESLLMKVYETNSLKEAYIMFLQAVSFNYIDSLDIGLTNKEAASFVKLFDNNSLKNEIWEFSIRDEVEVFELDRLGPFMYTFKNLKSESNIANDYYVLVMDAGSISYSLLAVEILENYFDYNDYILKRIVIIDILYRHCTLQLL